ncbi:putative membrane protein [Yarrowia sp. B02]|nr:putative membrane protein [Yarrowia sp. B02]
MSRGPELPESSFKKFTKEIGWHALVASSRDIKILIAQKVLRMIAYGQSTLILVQFFREIHVSDVSLGYFMTLTLLGDVIISYFLTLYADQLGRRNVLLLGSFLMMVSGIVFVFSDHFVILLLAAIVGVISPSGDETGPFKSIEESVVAHLTPTKELSDIYAWYGLFGTVGSAVGSVSAGLLIDGLVADGWTKLKVYRFMFAQYAFLAFLKLLLNYFLSDKCELRKRTEQEENPDESDPLLRPTDHHDPTPSQSPKFSIWGTPLSRRSRQVVWKLCILFALDSMGYGFMPISWVVTYFLDRWKASESAVGTLFFFTNVLNALSSLASSSMYKRLGPIIAIVAAHFPSAMAMSFIPLAPNMAIAMALLLFRASTAVMDVVPRQAFLSHVVSAEERTKVMGIVNVVKTLARSVGPIFTGMFAEKNMLGFAFLITGLLEAAHDMGMLTLFWKYNRIIKH